MLYQGYKVTIRCIDWEQVATIDKLWHLFASVVKRDKLIGLGMNWRDNTFDYALGVINDPATLGKLHELASSRDIFDMSYLETELPPEEEWTTFRGHDSEVRQIYEEQVDCHHQPYDYELEYIDDAKNIEIKIHYINS